MSVDDSRTALVADVGGEAQLRLLVEYVPVAVAMFDRDMRYIAVSRRWLSDYMPSVNDAIGRSHYDLFPECPPRWRDAHRRGLAGETIRVDEDSWSLPDGRRVWLRYEVRPWSQRDGSTGGILILIEDISESKRAEEDLRLTNERLQAALRASRMVVFNQDRDLRYTWIANPALGLDEHAVIGKRDVDLMEREQEAARTEEIKREVLRTGVPVRSQVRVHHQGVARHFDLIVEPQLDPADATVGVRCVAIDVTDRHEVEAALERSHAEATAAAERVQLALAAGAIVGTWDWDLTTDRFTIDERFAESFGIDPALGRSGLSLAQVIATVHPDDLRGLRTAIDAAIARGGPYRHEYRVARRDGSYHWIEANGRVDLARDGTPLRFPGVLIDIDQRHALETERDRAAALLRAFADAVPGVVYVKDREGRVLIANRGTTELIGKPPEFYLGRTDVEFLNNRQQAEAVMATDRRIMDSGQAEQLEEEVSFPDGRRAVWLSVKAPFRDESGQVIGLIGSSTDITARLRAEEALKASEERLRLALAAGELGIWQHDITADRLVLDERARAHFDMDCNDCSTEEWLARVHGDDLARLQAAVRDAMDSQKKGAVAIEYRVVHRDGRVRWLSIFGRVQFEQRGEVECAVMGAGTTADVTARREATEFLKKADQRKDEFIATLAHELRNPLAPIRTAVHVLASANVPEPRREQARAMIERQVQTMTRLVDDLLDVSRLTLGLIELRREPVSVGLAIDQALEAAGTAIRTGNHQLDLDIPDEPIVISADALRLTQVLINLLTNAARYTPPGGRISVSARAEGGLAVVRVADSGIGVAADQFERIFDMFTQGYARGRPAQGGLGIGLALAKRLVELHGGTIRVASDGVGRGAMFTVSVPLAAKGSGECSNPRPQAVARSIARRVLVVDDNVDAAESLVMMLEMLGHDTHAVHSGEAALAALDPADEVVLLDIGLPGIDGYEVARNIRARLGDRSPLLVAVTGWGQVADRDRTRAAGFDHHLSKPADPIAIAGLIASASPR